MRNAIYFILFWIPFICFAQTYRYISTVNGLSNQKIYRIQKDGKGYMWFLTHQGIDRYNGKEIKHYKLTDNDTNIDPQTNLDWIYVDKKGVLWVVGRKGRIFQYDSGHDRFNMVYRLPRFRGKESLRGIDCGFLDRNNRIWLCYKDSITLYDTQTGKIAQLRTHNERDITSVEQMDDTHFFIGTTEGLFQAELNGETLRRIPCPAIDSIRSPINELYFHPATLKLFIGTFREGVFIYDFLNPRKICMDVSLNDVMITRITALNKEEVLIATDGQGVYRVNTDSCLAVPYIVANYNSYNEMNGNNINDVYVDEEQRIWLSNYPSGITIRDNRYTNYKWIKHSIGNHQSLINDQIHSIIEDHDGDLWFGTSNGISLYRSKTETWHSFISSFKEEPGDKNHIFLTLCEVSPGVIWAGGHTSGLYQINKRDLSVQYFSPSSFYGQKIQPDQYIRAIKKDLDGYVWSGGYYNLKRLDLQNRKLRLYEGLSSITAILEKDREHMWIGTTMGLYLLEKESGSYKMIDLPVESTQICALCQVGDNLYIGTGGSGLLVYHLSDQTLIHYYTENCALISNNIYTIVSKPDGNILLGTENGIVNFSPQKRIFHNWTKEQGLMSATFNAGAGILRQNNHFILGSNDGAIEFPANIQLPSPQTPSPFILSDFRISYQTVYPGEKDSPLETDINETHTLKLKYEQNTFSLKVSSINYDYPSNTLFLWKLEGFYDKWSRTSPDGIIRFTKLPPGKYTLHIRSISNEEKYKVYEEREIQISIAPPVWGSTKAIIGYAALFVLALAILFRIMVLKRQKKISDEKTRFFINTAHDIRTPLTMIKAPLEELIEKKQVHTEGMKNMNMALKGVDSLLRLTTNLINFEKVDAYSSELYVAEYELNTYVTELYNSFLEYACLRNIQFTYDVGFSYLNVWFDKEKMDSILKNIISNALKYTPEGGSVHIAAYENKDYWGIEVKDTGIGIPAKELNKVFKSYFRGSNVINLKVSGSGIGLMLVYKLVRLHRGKITVNSVEGEGTCMKVSFAKGNKHLENAHFISPVQEDVFAQKASNRNLRSELKTAVTQEEEMKQLPHILIVEDNDDLRNYLEETLSEHYKTKSCSNGKEALEIVKKFNPALILSDVMMPKMRGDELCAKIKSDVETSHIPVILLTALGDEKSTLEGLNAGADDYIAKPFSLGILKASISNILANRDLLRKRYGNLEVDEEEMPATGLANQDWEFIALVKKNIEKNIHNPDFNVDMLCAMHNMSRTSFFNKIKALTGRSPSDHIRIIRLQYASQLLHQGHSVVEASDMSGFCDVKYFREVFKKHFKENPSQYIKANAQKKQEDDMLEKKKV